ncbi:serine hydrolase domain-containing protein [Kitasatospora sp. HPMI-4]|uniref:serine hydrolase domain-containing protein n=1 Tax=Kitasatospora sp. HPMI-4 TaxID=3448443 RepID=UPI003F1A96F4
MGKTQRRIRSRAGADVRRIGLRAAAAALVSATAVGLVAPAACAAAPPTAAGRAAERHTDPVALRDALQDLVDQGGVSAAIAAVRQDGDTVWQGAAGTADQATGRPAPVDGRFRIGSVTKTFVATVVLQLVAERRVELDGPIERYLPGVVPDGGAITLRQLLNHTSGIFDYTEDPSFERPDEAAERRWLAVDRWRTYQPRELVDIATRHAPYFRPGQGWHYSNTDYILAGMLIERTTGRSWAEEVERRIIRPLGLHDTSMPVTSPYVPGPHAHGYLKLSTGPADITLLNPSGASSAGAGISSTADLTRFDAALLGGRLLPPAELAEMKRAVDTGAGFGYGLGLMEFTTGCGEFWGHTGGIRGYATYLLGDAGAHRQVAVSANPYDVTDPARTSRLAHRLVELAACGTDGLPPAPAAPAAVGPATVPRLP